MPKRSRKAKPKNDARRIHSNGASPPAMRSYWPSPRTWMKLRQATPRSSGAGGGKWEGRGDGASPGTTIRTRREAALPTVPAGRIGPQSPRGGGGRRAAGRAGPGKGKGGPQSNLYTRETLQTAGPLQPEQSWFRRRPSPSHGLEKKCCSGVAEELKAATALASATVLPWAARGRILSRRRFARDRPTRTLLASPRAGRKPAIAPKSSLFYF
jgi:hypothetical protein